MNLARVIDWLLYIQCVVGLICIIALWAERKEQ